VTLGPVRVVEFGMAMKLFAYEVTIYMYVQCYQTRYIYIFIVACPLLTNPDNGAITCSPGDDKVPSYEDTCSFTCNTGYELAGSDTRTCQSNGSWSGSDSSCEDGT